MTPGLPAQGVTVAGASAVKLAYSKLRGTTILYTCGLVANVANVRTLLQLSTSAYVVGAVNVVPFMRIFVPTRIRPCETAVFVV